MGLAHDSSRWLYDKDPTLLRGRSLGEHMRGKTRNDGAPVEERFNEHTVEQHVKFKFAVLSPQQTGKYIQHNATKASARCLAVPAAPAALQTREGEKVVTTVMCDVNSNYATPRCLTSSS